MKVDTKTKHLYEAILLLKNADECKRFFRDLLTEAEIKEFSNRWQVAQMLYKKEPYEKITLATGMSSTTIARISKWLNGKLEGYKIMLERIQKTNPPAGGKKAHHHAPLLAA